MRESNRSITVQKISLISVSVLLIASAIAYFWNNSPGDTAALSEMNTPIKVQVKQAEMINEKQSFAYSGTIEESESVSLSFPVNGTVLKVKLKQSEIRLNKSKLKNGIDLVRMAFCQHLGLPLDAAPALIKKSVVIEPPASLFVDHAEALKSRNEYKLLGLSVKAEKLQTRMKAGEYLPQLGIGAGLYYLKFDESEGRSIGMVYSSLSLPISGWWGGIHELKKRKIKEKIAKNNLQDKSGLLLLQMDKARRDLDDAYTQYLLSEEAKAQAVENLRVNEDGYKNGLVTVSDLLEAQALLKQAEDQKTEATVSYLLKKTEYLQVTGL